MAQPLPGDTGLPATSGVSRLIAAAVGALAGAISLGTIGAVLTTADQPYWMVVGFEVVVLAAGVYSVLIARGRFRDGPGMALLCVAGTLFVAGVLGYLSTKGTQGTLLLKGRAVPMKPWALIHVSAAAVMALAAAREVLRRNPRSMYYLARAAMAGVPLAAIGAAAWIISTKLSGAVVVDTSYQLGAMDPDSGAAPTPTPTPPPGVLAAAPSWVWWLLGAVGSVAALVLFCACAHCVIRAFEMGRASVERE